jgi:hypothetical protein
MASVLDVMLLGRDPAFLLYLALPYFAAYLAHLVMIDLLEECLAHELAYPDDVLLVAFQDRQVSYPVHQVAFLGFQHSYFFCSLEVMMDLRASFLLHLVPFEVHQMLQALLEAFHVQEAFLVHQVAFPDLQVAFLDLLGAFQVLQEAFPPQLMAFLGLQWAFRAQLEASQVAFQEFPVAFLDLLVAFQVLPCCLGGPVGFLFEMMNLQEFLTKIQDHLASPCSELVGQAGLKME